ncbi:hypothetical protein AAGG52_21080 [Bacillus licheniformis]
MPYHILQKAETGYAVYNKTFRPVFQNGVFAEHIGLLDNLEELIGEAEKKGVIHFRLRKHGRTWNITGRRFFASDEALTVFTAENEKDVRISSLPGAAILSPLRMSYMETSRNETMQQVLKKRSCSRQGGNPYGSTERPAQGKRAWPG